MFSSPSACVLSNQGLGVLLVIATEAYIIWERRQRNIGRRDSRAAELYHGGMSMDDARNYLGDRHPEYQLEL